jgi:hypothetical protein
VRAQLGGESAGAREGVSHDWLRRGGL